MAQGTKEIHLEEDIVKYLVEQGGFHEVSPSAYDKELCLIPSEVIGFIQETQADKYNLLKLDQYGDKIDEKIVANIAKTYKDNKDKTLDLLRNKVKDRGISFDMVYWQPANNKTPEHELNYKQNRLAVVRQLKYSKRNENSIDLVLFVNGIPVVTLELKNELTGQNHHNAIKQYIQDRDPKGEPFLEFKRCLVHFAVGTEKVFMTTELKGKGTFFLPCHLPSLF
jgi:type I restriction enzyme R subunit